MIISLCLCLLFFNEPCLPSPFTQNNSSLLSRLVRQLSLHCFINFKADKSVPARQEQQMVNLA